MQIQTQAPTLFVPSPTREPLWRPEVQPSSGDSVTLTAAASDSRFYREGFKIGVTKVGLKFGAIQAPFTALSCLGPCTSLYGPTVGTAVALGLAGVGFLGTNLILGHLYGNMAVNAHSAGQGNSNINTRSILEAILPSLLPRILPNR